MTVYYDGVCGLCSRLVQVLMKMDQQHVLKFAPLQGESAAANLTSYDTENLNSIVVTKNGRTFRESDAVVQILLELQSWHWLGRALDLTPRFLRDFGYRIVARYRYRIWGKSDFCELPESSRRIESTKNMK